MLGIDQRLARLEYLVPMDVQGGIAREVTSAPDYEELTKALLPVESVAFETYREGVAPSSLARFHQPCPPLKGFA